MKRLACPLVVTIGLSLTACSNQHSNYETNLTTAKKMMAAHEAEDLDNFMASVSLNMEWQSPVYGSGIAGYEEYKEAVASYQNLFSDLKFNSPTWLPGTDESGQPDGSVRVYGRWTGTHDSTGTQVDLLAYHYFDFDTAGQVIAVGDFFDITGLFDSVGTAGTPVLVALKIKDGLLDTALGTLDSPEGLPATRAYEGCLSLERYVQPETNTIWISSTWVSNEAYDQYLEWRLNEDSFVSSKLTPLLVGGDRGLTINQMHSEMKKY